MSRSLKLESDSEVTTQTLPREICLLGVRDGYERWAPLYDGGANPLLAREERYLSTWISGLRGKAALDLACGTGRWLEPMTQAGASAVGVDISTGMLKMARSKPACCNFLVRARCECLPFSTAAFDAVICSFALGHVRDLTPLAQELARVTRPGASVVISDLHSEAQQNGWRVAFREGRGAVEIKTWSRSPDEIRETIDDAGFTCQAQETLFLGEPERECFVRAGKLASFAQACSVPAVLVLRLRRRESPGVRWSAR